MVETTILQGRYRLDGRVATGGMGTVFAATDNRLKRKVAVKVLREQLADDPRFVERFKREARAVATLSHPNIAGIFDYGEDDGRHFIVMEFIEGRDLARLLRDEAPMAPERAARIGAQICAALGHAHEMKIVHRDVKPANVIVDAAERVKVTDFGIARAAGDTTLTATGSVLGTAQYLSPEQASGAGVSPASDVYSAGIVLYEMLTGSVPFTGDSAIAVVMRHVTDEVPPPSSINRDVPPALDSIVAVATAKDPSTRSSALEMAAALRDAARDTAPAAIGGAVIGSTPTRPLDEAETVAGTAAWTPQRIGRAIALALAALALLLGLILVLNLIGRDNPSETTQRRRDRGGGGTQTEPQETPTQSTASYTVEASLIGMDKNDAKNYLEKDLDEFDFQVEEQEEFSDADKHTVVGVDPPPGTVVEPGSTITLLISVGSEEGKEEEGD